jgi:hypothetical protein
MPYKFKLPRGIHARKDRNGQTVFYIIDKDGKTIHFGKNLKKALVRWSKVEEHFTILKPPSTALDLLNAFERCSPPMENMYRVIRRASELEVLRKYLIGIGKPCLNEIGNERRFLDWYCTCQPNSPADDVIRLLRLMWRFALRLKFVSVTCPWESLDLRKARLWMEIADLLWPVSRSPLKELLEDLLGVAVLPAEVDSLILNGPSHVRNLQEELVFAASRAVTILRKCERIDLVVATHQLEVGFLLDLRKSPILPLVRPPGSIQVRHYRKEFIETLKARRETSENTPTSPEPPKLVARSFPS